VLHHLRPPLLALERVRSVTKKLLIMETHSDLHHIRRTAMAFYPGSEAGNDGTNWWEPNEACCVDKEQISSGRMVFHAEV